MTGHTYHEIRYSGPKIGGLYSLPVLILSGLVLIAEFY